jgi:hypothetical protein
MELINMKDGGLFFIDDGDVSTMGFKAFSGKHYGIDGDDGHDGKVITAMIQNHRGESFEVPCLYSRYLTEKCRIEASDPFVSPGCAKTRDKIA